MESHKMISRVEDGKVLVLERVYDVSRDVLFTLFKDSRHLQRWWGPRGWELPVCNVDFRPGGAWHYCMKCVDTNQDHFGMESWGKTIYKEIVEPEKIVYTDYFSDADGNIDESMPAPEVTMEFVDLGAQVKLISRSVYDSEQSLKSVLDMGVVEGVTQTWDRLQELVETL